MILVFRMLSFKPAFTLLKRLFSSSLLSVFRVVSSAYLRLLIILLAILIPACDASSPAFHLMYSAYKLNRVTIYCLVILLSQFRTSQLFSVWFYLLLLDLHRRQVRWSGIPILLRIIFQFVVFHAVLKT